MKNYIVAFISLLAALSIAVVTSAASPPVKVVGDQHGLTPRQPQAVVDDDGAIYIAFGSGRRVYVSKSTDQGRTYGDPVLVGDVPALALGMRRGPRIVARNGAVVVSAIGHEAGNLLAWTSSDGGVNWSEPVQINDVPASAVEGLHAMAIGPAGQAYCAWLDLRSRRTEIYGARSPDNGKTWTANRRIYASPSGSVCECCHPSVAYGSQGQLFVMWRNSIRGYRDMYSAVSTDDGETFTGTEKLGVGGWKLDACPMDGGSLAALSDGTVISTWRRENEVFRSESGGDKEHRLGTGLQPSVAASQDGANLVWLSRRNGELWLLTPHMAEPNMLSANADSPMIASPFFRPGPLIVVWETEHDGATEILAAVRDQQPQRDR